MLVTDRGRKLRRFRNALALLAASLILAGTLPASAAPTGCKTFADQLRDEDIYKIPYGSNNRIKSPYPSARIDFRSLSLRVSGSDLLVVFGVTDLEVAPPPMDKAYWYMRWYITSPGRTDLYRVKVRNESGAWFYETDVSSNYTPWYTDPLARPTPLLGSVERYNYPTPDLITVRFPLSKLDTSRGHILSSIKAESADGFAHDTTGEEDPFDARKFDLFGSCPQ